MRELTGRRLGSRSWAFDTLVWWAMGLGWLPWLVWGPLDWFVGLGVPGALLWIGCVPLLPVLVALLRRPRRVVPDAPVREVGRTLGHDWVDFGSTVVWVQPEDADQLMARPTEPPAFRPTHGGFSLDVPAPGRRFPRANYVTGTAHGAVSSLVFLLLVTGALFWMEVVTLGPGGLPVLLTDELIPSLMGVLMPALLATFAAGIVLGLAMLPYHFVLALLFRGLQGGSGSTRVELEGRILSAGGQTFHLAEPQRSVRLERAEGGERLVLQNQRQRMVIPGRHAELVWLRDQIDGMERSEAGAEEVPEDLARLARAAGRTE